MILLQLPVLMFRAIFDAQALAWITLSVLLGWAILPMFHALLPRLRFAGYFCARVGGLALLTYMAWILSHDARSNMPLASPAPPHSLLASIGNGPGVVALNNESLAILLIAILVVSAFAWRRWGKETLRRIRAPRTRKFILAGEICFVLFFLLGGALRLVSHGLVDQEKFMDAAFLKSCVDATTLPPGDPWLYQSGINYYYGGYLAMAMPARLLGTTPEIAFNLAIALLFGLSASLVFALAAELTPRIRSAALATAVVLVAGNLAILPQAAAYVRSSPPWQGFSFDWWAPSRVIHDRIPGADPFATINEFPFFTFYHADLHPHLMAIPFALMLAAAVLHVFLSLARTRTAFGTKRGPALARFLFTAWCLGWLAMINGFDFIAWTFVVGVAFLLAARWIRCPTDRPYPFRKALGWTVALVVLAVGFFYPFWANFHPPVEGQPFEWNGSLLSLPAALFHHVREGLPIGFSEFRSRPDQFLLVWGALIVPPALLGLLTFVRLRRQCDREIRFLLDVGIVVGSILAVLLLGGLVPGGLAVLSASILFKAAHGKRGPRRAAASWLLLTGLGLILLCEMVFVRDAYGRGLQRMNTIFKFHFIAWIILGMTFPFCLREAWRSPILRRKARAAVGVTVAVLLAVAFAYPVLAIRERLDAWESLSFGAPGYDGLRFLQRNLPGDYAAIVWLREHARTGAVLLEATGEPYTLYARISTFAPVRSVLGWANHERVWRGKLSPDIERDVRALYEEPSLDAVRPLLDRYGITYVYVGALERRDFPREALAKFDSALPVVYRNPVHDVVIYEVPHPGPSATGPETPHGK